MAGQDVFVLTAIEGKEERPVAVVTNEQTANNWVQEGKDHNWIPFSLDDTQGLGTYTPFRPAPGSPAEAEMKKREAEQQELVQLRDLVTKLGESNKKLMTALKKRGISLPGQTSSLLKHAHVLAEEQYL